MKDQIEQFLKDKDVISEINFMGKNQSTFFPGKLIGEVIHYCIIHQSDKEIKKEDVVQYLQDIKYVMFEADKRGKEERESFFSNERSKIILKSIAKSLEIDLSNGIIAQEDQEKIKNYFLNNYVKNGYVFHSFPTARKNSVIQQGFTEIEQIWNDAQVKEVVKIFEDHGVLKALGGYGFYKPGGTYVEHDPENILFHSISSPEWFKFFTSSSHVESTQDLSKSPFFLKDYDACRQNVEDLCRNSRLTKGESAKVLALFESCWEKLGTKELTTAMIPRDKVGKDDIAKAVSADLDLLDTISYVLDDKAEQFTEHTGNVVDSSVMKRIHGADIEVVEIPSADIFIQSPTYQRETREELYDPVKNIRAIYYGIVSSNATMRLTQKQYNKVFNQIEETFADNPDKLEDVKENWIKFDQSIQHSSLESEKQDEIVNDFRDMETKRQELNFQNSYQTPSNTNQ